jgi:hypothetical protein
MPDPISAPEPGSRPSTFAHLTPNGQVQQVVPPGGLVRLFVPPGFDSFRPGFDAEEHLAGHDDVGRHDRQQIGGSDP